MEWFAAFRRLIAAVLSDLKRHETTLVCAGLTLYFIAFVVPIGTLLWWIAPVTTVLVRDLFVQLAHLFVGQEAAVWLADFLSAQARQPLQLSAWVPFGVSLAVAGYSASRFMEHLQRHLIRLWYGRAVELSRQRWWRPILSFALFLLATAVAAGIYGSAQRIILSLPPLGGAVATLIAATWATMLIVALLLAVGGIATLRSRVLWQVSFVSATLLVLGGTVLASGLGFLRSLGTAAGMEFAPVAVLVWLWTMWWFFFFSVQLGKYVRRE